jgi:hypothetical protein
LFQFEVFYRVRGRRQGKIAKTFPFYPIHLNIPKTRDYQDYPVDFTYSGNLATSATMKAQLTPDKIVRPPAKTTSGELAPQRSLRASICSLMRSGHVVEGN